MRATADLSQFSDGADVSTWAQEAMQWAVGAGIMHGDDFGQLNSHNSLSRAEAAVMMQGLIAYTLGNR